ncbi:hypothetical protein Tco_0254085, partial [Tanacetum coccineum]
MMKVAKLLPDPQETLILLSQEVNADNTTDKSFSGTFVQPVGQPKAPTDKKSEKKKNPASFKPKTLKIVRESSLIKQVTETQHVEESVTIGDATKSVDAFESTEE